ncbi:MAG: cytochrome C oxidase subunit IV family protein [Amphritea sp.]
MLNSKSINFIWGALMAVTIGSAFLAESGETNLLVTLLICLSIAFKGRMVVDRFMELRNANRYIHFSMSLYFYVVPALILAVYLLPDELARMTTL